MTSPLIPGSIPIAVYCPGQNCKSNNTKHPPPGTVSDLAFLSPCGSAL